MRTFQTPYVQSENIVLACIKIQWNLYSLQYEVNKIPYVQSENIVLGCIKILWNLYRLQYDVNKIPYVQSENIVLGCIKIQWNFYGLQYEVNTISAALGAILGKKNTCREYYLERSLNLLKAKRYLTFAWRDIFPFLGIKIGDFIFSIIFS
jgi:hypothetical protein